MKRLVLISSLIFCALSLFGRGFCLECNTVVRVSDCSAEAPVVWSAMEMLSGDLEAVLGCRLTRANKGARIIVATGTQGVSKHLNDKERDFLNVQKEGFVIKVLPSGKLLISGSDSHGTAYGLLELSRLMGVSPWEWWADAVPERKSRFELPSGYCDMQAPSVEYRGIFINDEDWGLMPWSSQTHEPGNKRGIIGDKTSRRIFELLLRLRANTYWPPMHECSEPFFLTPGNREMARRYGIYIGSSHCEPMASSAAVEWGRRGIGEYDYVNNSGNVLKFWEDRVKEVADQEIVYTIGMRGVHDGPMNGAQSVEAQKSVLARVMSDQRKLLTKYVDREVAKVPQVFIPYKEVLEVYNAGLEVPEDVTLMWCDDNYGFIRHFPDSTERARKGGNGVYYHVSYWGRPHDYLWLGTVSPELIYQQMEEAYGRGIRKMWILNVGDIKPTEYQIELFMDMAWDIDKVVRQGVQLHLRDFLSREFGEDKAVRLLPVMNEHYHLAYVRKPEFLGNTRCEEYGPGSEKWSKVSDLPWSDEYIKRRIADYEELSAEVESINGNIGKSRLDTYFQLVKYPVQAAAEMNKKMLYGQLARHGKAGWDKSRLAYDSIMALTETYNRGICNGGKWNGIMDCRPRRQPVFEPLEECEAYESPEIATGRVISADVCKGEGLREYLGLGISGNAVGLPERRPVDFNIGELDNDTVSIAFNFVPTHPVEEGKGLKCKVWLNDGDVTIVDYSTKGRSEEWKNNILNGKATRRVGPMTARGAGNVLHVEALTEGVILDYIEIR